MRRSLLPLILCLVLWESGNLQILDVLSPQGAILEYRLIACPPEVGLDHVVAVQGRLRLPDRTFAWGDLLRTVIPPPGAWPSITDVPPDPQY